VWWEEGLGRSVVGDGLECSVVGELGWCLVVDGLECSLLGVGLGCSMVTEFHLYESLAEFGGQ
jgi:hypothetical protein